MQLAMRKHVLVYHLCKARTECAALKDFLRNKGIIFASVDVRNDRDVLANSFLKIPRECHIDLQEELMIKGGNLRDSMADLAGAVINKSYLSMKSSFPQGLHDYWEWKPLSLEHLKYAAIVSENFVFIFLFYCNNSTFSLNVYLHSHPLFILGWVCQLRALPPSSVDEGHDASSLSSRPQRPLMFPSRIPTE